MEKVQIKAVNLITELKGKTYMEKLQELGIQSLEQRRVRFDFIQTFKILRGYDKVEKVYFGRFRRYETHTNDVLQR